MNMQTIMAGPIMGVVVAVLLMIFGSILPNLNQTAIGLPSYNIILIIPLVSAAGVLLAIVMNTFGTNLS